MGGGGRANGNGCILGWQHCLMASLHVSVEEHRFLGRPDAVRPRTCGSPTVDAQISAAAFNGLRSRERAASTEQQKERFRRAPAACGMGAWAAEMQMPCSCSCMSEAGNGVRSNAGGQGAELRELGGWGGCLAPLLRLLGSKRPHRCLRGLFRSTKESAAALHCLRVWRSGFL